MHVSAPHPNCAYKWIEHSIAPTVQGDVAAWFGSVPTVPTACASNKLLGAEGCKTNGSENFDKISFWRTPVAACGSDKQCIPYAKWTSNYLEIIGS
jgi:putative spermidine/putrescine transport system substrate-binding protein